MTFWPKKDPDEILDYVVDWASKRLKVGETLASSTFTVVSGDVVIASQTFSAGFSTVWLSGGTNGTISKIINRVTTNQGRTYEVSRSIRIRSTVRG